MTQLEDLNLRLKDVIVNFCNKIGCGNCGLEWKENGQDKCSATELQSKIMDIEFNPNNKSEVK